MEPQGTLISASRSITANTYREDGYETIPSVILGDEEYGRGLQRFIGVCTDIAIINIDRQEIFLARRRSKPLTGWWWIGGGQRVNETKVEAAIRNFKRETRIELEPDQLVYRCSPDYFWKDRRQDPQTIGCHMLGRTFTVELSDGEIAGIRLARDEYEAERGFTAFTREKLVEAGVYPAIIDLYDTVFPKS